MAVGAPRKIIPDSPDAPVGTVAAATAQAPDAVWHVCGVRVSYGCRSSPPELLLPPEPFNCIEPIHMPTLHYTIRRALQHESYSTDEMVCEREKGGGGLRVRPMIPMVLRAEITKACLFIPWGFAHWDARIMETTVCSLDFKAEFLGFSLSTLLICLAYCTLPSLPTWLVSMLYRLCRPPESIWPSATNEKGGKKHIIDPLFLRTAQEWPGKP